MKQFCVSLVERKSTVNSVGKDSAITIHPSSVNLDLIFKMRNGNDETENCKYMELDNNWLVIIVLITNLNTRINTMTTMKEMANIVRHHSIWKTCMMMPTNFF